MSGSPKYSGSDLNSGKAKPIHIRTTPCVPPKLSGPVGENKCEPEKGGTKTIAPAEFVLIVANGPLNFGDCNIWQDDDQQLVREANNDIICIDNA